MVSIVQSESASGTTGASGSVVVALPAPVTPGNAVVYVGLAWGSSTTAFVSISDDKSDNFPAPDVNYNPSASSGLVVIGCLPNVTTGPKTFTLDIANASAFTAMRIYEVSGLGTSSPLDDTATTFISLSASPLNTAYTATQSTDFAVAGWINTSADTSSVAGWTVDDFFSSGNWCTGHLISPANGANTWSNATTANTAAIVGIATYLAGTIVTPGLEAWNAPIVGDFQRRIITAPVTLLGRGFSGGAPAGTVVNIFPVSAGSSGSFTITDNGVEVFTIAAADIVAGLAIPAGVTCMHDITVSQVPTGGEFGVLWEQGGAAAL